MPRLIAPLPIGFLFALSWLVLPRASAAAPRAPQAIVEAFCGGCHGALLTGGNGPNLLDGLSHHGNDDASVRASIAKGWPASGMPPFGEVLAEGEIDALVAFIRGQRPEFRAGRIKPPVPPDVVTVTSERMTFRVETVTSGLGTPWGLAFLPDGRMLVSEREGRLRVVAADGKLEPQAIRGTPTCFVRQDGGMLDVAVHPRFAENGWVYLAYVEQGTRPTATMTVVVRGRLREGAWVDQQDVFRVPERYYVENDYSHYGCRFLFDGEGHLFFGIGDRGRPMEAQDLSSPLGKIHRVHDDGSAPADNPFVGTEGAWPTIWSYGHRHVQGLAFEPRSGKLWATEHGPRGGDEINLVRPGANYGWPLISHGQPQFGETIGGTERVGLDQPVVFYPQSIAPGAVAFVTGDRYSGWRNQLLVATLVSEHLRRLEIDETGRVVHQEPLFYRLGRVRDVTMGPDGLLYLLFNGPGRIARIVPVK